MQLESPGDQLRVLGSGMLSAYSSRYEQALLIDPDVVTNAKAVGCAVTYVTCRGGGRNFFLALPLEEVQAKIKLAKKRRAEAATPTLPNLLPPDESEEDDG